MPTPIGHSLGGLVLLVKSKPAGSVNWRHVLFCLFFANAADLDFIAGFLLGSPNMYHHGISHSIGMGVVAGFCVTLLILMLKKSNPVYTGVAAMAFYSTHVFLDFFSLDSSWPYGVPCFWPLTDQYFISPVSLFTDVKRGATTVSFFSGLFSYHNFFAVLREIVVISLFYLCVKKLKRRFLN